MPSETLKEYMDMMSDSVKMLYPNIDDKVLYEALKYSIKKRYKPTNASIENNYTREKVDKTVLQLCDYIADKKPIITAYGVLFQRHGSMPNPLKEIIEDFLTARGIHKNQMFQYPKGHEMFEYYNLLQSLDKIDANGLYGTLGMYKALIYNRNVATSITAQGRLYISSAGMFFEQFLADNVKFNSLDEIVVFINHVKSEKPHRKYNDAIILSRYISKEELFAKLVLECGYNWIPDENDLDKIWTMVANLDQEELNRIYYKNNLYDFLDNEYMRNFIRSMMAILKTPFMSPSEIPEELKDMLIEFTNILEEYVMNKFPVMDRINRWRDMIKSVSIISDTDSAFVNLDAWVNYATMVIGDMDLNILHEKYYINPFEDSNLDYYEDKDENIRIDPFYKIEPKMDYDFYNDEVIELPRLEDPFEVSPQDNLRYSLINIMSYVVSELCNKYIEYVVKDTNQMEDNGKCRMYLKNEFLMKRILVTYVKKNYASKQELQEGNKIPDNIDQALDVKGIPSLVKSVSADSTKKALKDILYNDILNIDKIDQIKVLKDLAVLEKRIIQSLYDGSKEFYKPSTVKSMSAYADPMRIQGIKAIMAWNALRRDGEIALNLDERNPVSIAKVKLNKGNLESIKSKDPILYEKAVKLFEDEVWKGSIDSIAIPLEQNVPEWITIILDYDKIINDNISGFPLESINIRKASDNINYINTIKL